MQPPIEAIRIAPALAHRAWSIEGATRCRLFLLAGGRGSWTASGQKPSELAAPALLWLPYSARGTVRIMAGGEGFVAIVTADLARRVASDPAVTMPLRPLLDRVVLAGPPELAADVAMLAGVFAHLVDESAGRRPAATAMAGLHLATLLLQMWRCVGAPASAGRGVNRPAGDGSARQFLQQVELHYREGLRIDEFARRLGVTRAHLHRACLRATGQTPLALLHRRLLDEARARLTQTELSVEQVGDGLGFADPGYFNRFFKRLTGLAPGAYRRAARRTPPDPSFAAWP